MMYATFENKRHNQTPKTPDSRIFTPLVEGVEYATLEWVDWFNNRRLLEPIGNVPPAEFEAKYHQSQSTGQLPMAA